MTTPLQKAAQAMIDRWDSPAWKDQPHTAEYIAELRKSLDAEIAQAVEPAFWLNECGQLSATRGWAERNSPGSKLTPLYLHPPQPQATTPAVLKRLSDEAKRGLVGAWFSEDWAQKAAYGMLDDFETAQGEKP